MVLKYYQSYQKWHHELSGGKFDVNYHVKHVIWNAIYGNSGRLKAVNCLRITLHVLDA